MAPQVVEAGRLTFLLRGLEDTPRVDDKGRRRVSFQEPTAVEAQPTEVVEDSSSEARGSRSAVGLSVPSLGPLRGNREGVSVDERVDLEELVCAGEDCVSIEPVDHPIPSLEEGEAIAAEDPTDPLDPSEVELGAGGTYQHVAQGHFPFLASCTSCCRASGRVPARRLRHTRGKCELAADFCFFGRVRLLVMVVLYTGMIASCVMDGSDHDRNVKGSKPKHSAAQLPVSSSVCLLGLEALSQKPEFEMPNCIPAIQHVMTTAVELRKTFADASVKL